MRFPVASYGEYSSLLFCTDSDAHRLFGCDVNAHRFHSYILASLHNDLLEQARGFKYLGRGVGFSSTKLCTPRSPCSCERPPHAETRPPRRLPHHGRNSPPRVMVDTRQFPTINVRNPTSTIDDLQWTTLPFVIVFLPLALSAPRPLVHRPPVGHRNNNDARP